MTESLSRRRLLGAAAVAAASVGLGAPAAAAATTGTSPSYTSARPSLPSGLFTLGVASGDPLPTSTVLWTRLAPDPIAGGGMPERAVEVQWEVATDERFRRVVRRGSEYARPESGHSVHVDPQGLRPDTEYFYRFRAGGTGGEISPVGRTRTAPAPGSRAGSLRFAFASCQNFSAGYFHLYRDLVQQDVAFVAFLGDYIYESAPVATSLRVHEGTGEPYSLVNYRNRYAQYRTDPDLQAGHAAAPWVVTLDDHEIDNNWADDIPQDPANQTPEAFRARRIAAFQAWYEHMPVRRTSRPSGPDMQVFRRFDFGDLARVHVLDTRQYRSDQVATIAEAEDPSRTMLGERQEKWLDAGLVSGGQKWNLLANQTQVATNDRTAGEVDSFDLDNWDGYRASRRKLMDTFASPRVANPVVLTGDRHSTFIMNLERNPEQQGTAVVGAELCGTSITSGGDIPPSSQQQFHTTYDPIAAESPHWRYWDNRRGYILCDVSRDRMESTLRSTEVVTKQEGAPVIPAARFVTESGRRGVTVA
ncbi:alkaline phosphatase D family protein [Streptomyces sp. NPDC007861]|uniref:alkaline phosphatase D family protein n=1 Tax=Streptomyces sp. NPDC007861 TaxID=3154893 RepID=UPI003401F503